jgi:hypothetical protein
MTETTETTIRDLLKGRKLTVTTIQTENTAENGCRYACTLLADGKPLHTFEWSCGSLYPISRFLNSNGERLDNGKTVWPMHDHDLREARREPQGLMSQQPSAKVHEMQTVIRHHFKPTVMDLVPSLLLDASMIDNYNGWEDMHEEFGIENTAEKLRESQSSWLLCHKARAVLHKALGNDYANAAELAGQL